MPRTISRTANIQRFVERQMRNWELAKQQRPSRPRTLRQAIHFYITISREEGCRGEVIAERLARQLGWQKFDKEILEYMAQAADVRRQLFESLDERQVGWMEEMLGLISRETAARRDEYVSALTRAIFAICYHTHAVIVGRGANFVLPPERGLRVRLVAPLDYRVAVCAKVHGVDPKKARRIIKQLEDERAGFLARQFSPLPYDPRHYDLVINIQPFTDAQVVGLIVEAARAKAKGRLPNGALR